MKIKTHNSHNQDTLKQWKPVQLEFDIELLLS